MNTWEVTEDDVRDVLERHNCHYSDEQISEIHDLLDCDSVESAVLCFEHLPQLTQDAIRAVGQPWHDMVEKQHLENMLV